MTRTPSHNAPRWSIRLERSRRSNRTQDRWRGLRVVVMSSFLAHLIAFMSIMVMLSFINILTWSGSVWVIYPLVSWGALLTIHGGVTWLVATAGVSERMVERVQQPVRQPAIKTGTPAVELRQIIQNGLVKVDDMRSIARRMQSSQARYDVVEIASLAESTLLILEEHPEDLPLARQYATTFLEPAWRILTEYDRLRERGVESANSVLREVEVQDLPRMRDRANKVYQRVNRGSIIDLQVAREMLELGREADGAAPAG